MNTLNILDERIKDKFVGLDIETTGSAFIDEHKVIQIGLAARGNDTNTLSSTGYTILPDSEFVMEPEATAVHKISMERIMDGLPPAEAAEYCNNFLNYTLGEDFERIIAVGWNVAGFDMPFVRRDLPELASRFSYRTCDLNAINYLASMILAYNEKKLKEKAKGYALERIGGNAKWHDARIDAIGALYCLEFYINFFTKKDNIFYLLSEAFEKGGK